MNIFSFFFSFLGAKISILKDEQMVFSLTPKKELITLCSMEPKESQKERKRAKKMLASQRKRGEMRDAKYLAYFNNKLCDGGLDSECV